MARILPVVLIALLAGCASDVTREALAERRLRLSAGVISDTAVQTRVERIACALDRSTCARLRIFVLKQNRVHADLIGNVMRISLGMLSATGSDDALAFVIGHEIAHARLEHRPSKEWARAEAIEVEADALGFRMMRDAGYDGREALALLARLLARERAESNPGKEAVRQLEKRRTELARLLELSASRRA